LRILLLNEYYPPDTSATAKMAALVAATLAERHEVIVLAGRPSYDPSERHPFYWLRRETQGNLTVERVGSTTYPRFRMRHRITNYLTYLSLAVPRALFMRADLILAMTDPPIAGIAGAFVAMLKRRPFVYNIRDLYPDMALGGEIVRPSRWVALWEKLHRWALRRAARVIVLGEDMRDRIVAKDVDPDRISIVRDGVEVPATFGFADHPASREVRCGFPFVMLHAGNLGFYGAWETLVRAAQFLEKDGVGLVFVGEGSLRPRVEEMAKGCVAVRFLSFRPSDQVSYVLAAPDVHIVTVRRGLEGVVVPSKLYGILAAGKPVLVVAAHNSDVAKIVLRTGSGLVADPDAPASVASAVQTLRAEPERLVEMGHRARLASYEFERHGQLQILVKAIEKVRTED